MLFRLETTNRFIRTVECSSRAEACALARAEEAEAAKHNHHGEVTNVRVMTFADHIEECDECGNAQPCAFGLDQIKGEL